MLVDGKDADAGEYPPGSRVVVDLGGSLLYVKVLRAVCGDPAGRVTIAQEDGLLTISADLLAKGPARTVRWPQVAYCAYGMAIHTAEGTLEDYDKYMESRELRHRIVDDVVHLTWKTAWAELTLDALARVADIATMDRGFQERIDGRPVPVTRLSSTPLV